MDGSVIPAIRGLRSAASLKLGVLSAEIHVHGTIRGLRSAASLKRAWARRSYRHRSVDPRTQIRGLIEAASPEAWSRPAGPSDPRTQIRGLIEASRGRPGAGAPRGPIRGLRSAASLKRAPDAGAQAGFICDPRTQIRGLIEASLPARPARGTPGDPRTQIRGLIEAGA